MKEKILIQNIYRLLDGELSITEKEDLERYIAAHPEAEKLYKQILDVKNQFKSLPEEEVDSALKTSILTKIQSERSEQKDRSEIIYVQSFWQRPAVKFGFMFITGLFAGMLFLSILKSDFSLINSDTENLKGSFYNPRSFEEMKVTNVIAFDNADIHAICNARYSANKVEIHLDLTSAQMLTAILEFDNSNFSVFAVQPAGENQQSSSLVASGSVVFNSLGTSKYIILLNNKKTISNLINFRLLQDSQPLYNNTITIN